MPTCVGSSGSSLAWRCFKKVKPVHDLDGYSVVCGEQIFVFGVVKGSYLFTEIGVND
ncbi:MAG: hypothetical protein ABL970_09070 [Nitrospira sp.]